MRQGEAELQEGSRHAEGEGREDEGGGQGGDRDPEDERGTVGLAFLTGKRFCNGQIYQMAPTY